MLVYILVGVLLVIIVYMLWNIIARQNELKREDRYYTENRLPVYDYPEYNGWWWPGTSMIYGTGGWWRPPFWRGVDGDWGSGWQPGHVSPHWRGGGYSYQPPAMPGGNRHPGGHPGGLPGMGAGGVAAGGVAAGVGGGRGGGAAAGGGGHGGAAAGGGGGGGGGHGGGGK